MNIDNFKGAINSSGGLQKSSHFQCEIYGPSGLEIPYGNASAHCFVKDVTLPGRNMTTSEIKYAGLPTTKQVYNSIPSDCTVTFMTDGDMELWRYFQSWQRKIHDPLTGAVGYPDEYKGVVKIKTFNTVGNTTHEQALFDAFPENLGDISLSYGAEEIASFSVTFSYTRIEEDQGVGGIGLNSLVSGILSNLNLSFSIGPFSARIGF